MASVVDFLAPRVTCSIYLPDLSLPCLLMGNKPGTVCSDRQRFSEGPLHVASVISAG